MCVGAALAGRFVVHGARSSRRPRERMSSTRTRGWPSGVNLTSSSTPRRRANAWAIRLKESEYAYARAIVTPSSHGFDRERLTRGIRAAEALAVEAERRRLAKLYSPWERAGLTPEERGRTPVEMYGGRLTRVLGDVAYARKALFGEIGDRAIRHRLQRFEQRAARDPRTCQVEGCDKLLPPQARRSRRRCDACRAAGRR